MNNITIRLTALAITLLFFATDVCAQLPIGQDTPIDGGVVGLLAAAGIYGAKKIREKRKQK